MALPLIGALAGLGRVAGAAAVGPTARVGYGAALGGLAKDAVVGAGKGFVGGLKGAMMTEAPGLTGAYAFGKELKKRANASRENASPPSPTNKSSSNTPVIGGLGSLNTASIVVGQKQSNIINLEQVRQLKQLNDSVINQSKLIAYQIDDTRRKNQFAEEAANEQAIRDDKLLEAIRNIGGLGKNGRGVDAANDSSGGGFLSSLLGSLTGGAGAAAISKLVPLLSGAMAALPWARILRLATPVGAALSLGGSTPDKQTQQKQNKFYEDRAIKQAQERAAEEAKNEPRPLDGSRGNYRNNQRIWDEKYKGRKDPVTGKTIPGIYNIPVSGEVTSTTGTRKTKTPGMSKNHQGIDIAAVLGSPVNSIARGKVIEVDKEGGVPDANGHKKGLGRFVTIDHGQGVISKYGHLSVVSVNKGDEVGPGVLLGKSGGNTEDPGSGATTGPHLHLETTNFGKFIDPASLPGLVALGQVKNVVQLGAAAGLPPAVTSPAAGNSPAQSSAATGGKRSNIIQSNTGSNAGPLGEFYAQNAANRDAIKTNSAVKNGILTSLSGKSLEQLTVLRKQVENISLDASDKAEVLKAIDEEIKKKTLPAVIPKTSSSAYDQILAAFSAPFDKSKYGAGVQLASLDTGIRSDAGGGGSNFRVKQEVVQTNDENTQKKLDVIAGGLGVSTVTGRPLATNVAYQGRQLNTTVEKFKPLFRNNSEILEDANKAFLKELRSTFTSIFNTGLTEALLPNGVGVSASQAGRDDMYRGEQLKQINDTSKKISEGAVKLFGPKFGPMFGPLIDRMSTSYLEVGSRMAGKAIFQKIGGLDANDTMTLTGQVLGNYAAGKKELALEQLLYGASGGKNGGIALGTETLFAKYGFKDPMEGISYFANALGEKATQPFAKMMGSDDRSKSIIWNPRAGDKGTGAFVYADNGRLASDADIKASGNYGASMSQTSIVPGMNNFGMSFDPYGTTAGVNGTYKYNGAGSQFQQMLQSKPGAGPSRAQYFGLTDQQQAAGGIELKARQDLQIAADVELANKARDQQQKLAEEGAKRQFDIASKQASNAQEQAAAQAAFDKAMTSAQISSGTADTGAVIAKLDELKNGTTGSGSVLRDKDGNPIVRQPGQLFSQSLDKNGKVINDPLKEIGNFGFDMLKNAAGNALTKDIKNPYTQMIANFAIQKGLNYGVDALLGKTGETGLLEKGFDYLTSSATSEAGGGILSTLWSSVTSLYAGGGPVTGPGSGTSDSIPAMLSNGEFVINAKAAKENMALLTAINGSGLTAGKPQGFKKGGPAKGGGTLSDMLSGFLSSIGVTGEGLAAYEARQSSQVVSSSGVYNGFSMARGPDGTMVVDKPGYYDAGKSIASFGKNVSNFGGLLGGLIPGKNAVGVAAQLIGGLMTAPFDRQQDFYSNMESGILGGAMSIGNGNYAMMDGTVRDATGTTIGGTWTDSSGNDIRSGGGSLSFGVGPNYSAQIASNMSSISESSQNSMAGSDVGPSPGASGVPFASGGNVTGPGSGTSDSIPAMLSNGEFVVNALATKKYRPLLDAINGLNVKHLEAGSGADSASVETLSKVLGTNETNSQLAISNETLTSIDGSLRTISGRSTTGSGTAISRTGSGLSFDTGLGAFGGPASGGMGGNQVMGTAIGGGRSAPSTMDIIGNVAANVAKGYLVKAGITAVTGGMMGSLGAVLPSMYGAYSFAGGGMAGVAAAAETGVALTSMAIAEGATAVMAGIEAGLAAIGPVGWVILGGLALFSIFGGGGSSSPPPKHPKFHAAMYVSGNNNPNAIAPIHETTDYHAVPDNYKTIAYGLLRVAFNATKASEAVTKIPSPWDWLYMKIQFDRMSLIWGKGAPPKESLLADTYPENMSWPAPAAGMNLNTVASDIIDRITKEFKTNLAAADANLAKLDTAATGLKNYTLDELSSGLIDELKSGKLKLDSTIQKGIYAADVNESNRIAALINAAAIKASYITDSQGNPIVSDTIPAGGTNMVYSMKQGKFVKNPYGLDTILLDAQDRPVYNIEGTSAGLTIDDFVSAERAGARTANILAPPVTAGSAGGNGATVVNAPSVITTDASSLEIYYATNQTTIDSLRAAQTQTG